MRFLYSPWVKIALSFTMIITLLFSSSSIAFANDPSSINNTDMESEMEEMTQNLIENVSSEAVSIGQPIIMKLDSSKSIVPFSITYQDPLISNVTFSRTHWGSYRKYDGNRIAVSFRFVVPSDSGPGYQVTLALFEYGQQYLTNGITLHIIKIKYIPLQQKI